MHTVFIILVVLGFFGGGAYFLRNDGGGLHTEDKTVYPNDTDAQIKARDPNTTSNPTQSYIDKI